MPQATVTSKGQITIPKSIRDRLHLIEGDKVAFMISDSGDAIMRPIAKRVDEVYGILASPKRKALSTDEIKSRLKQSFRKKQI